MARYALRRVLQAIPILFILSILLFAMVRAAPGGPLSTAYRNPNVTKEQIELLKKQLGLDKPLPVQYVNWLGDMLRGDMGESIKFRRPVSEMIGERIPNTLILVGELLSRPVNRDVAAAEKLIRRGRYATAFWGGVVGAGAVVPLAVLLLTRAWTGGAPLAAAAAAILNLAALLIHEAVFVKAGQAVPLS